MSEHNSFTFTSEFTPGPNFDMKFSQDEVKNEPMLFNCDREAAYDKGGFITRSFLKAFDKARPLSGPIVVDTRVHMLMPGWYPAIPGYHHDDVPRNTQDGQPNYHSAPYHAQHCMGLINGDICPTEFAIGRCRLDLPGEGEGPVYKKWHRDVVDLIEKKRLEIRTAPSGRLVFFDAHAFHQGTMAIANGWRWFGRISWNTHRIPTNEVRRQVQVYMENPMEGW